MNDKLIFIMVLVSSFFQILHIFEEIRFKAYAVIKGEHFQGTYLRIAALLVFLNYIVLFLLFTENSYAYYTVFYTVIISVVNTLAHTVMLFKVKKKGTYGYGFPSSVPLGISGIILLYFLVEHFTRS